ncbi:aldo/keto reductase [Streptosporangium saharense]|uniref:aldo/keto reductase n=1 Tax=Streptosporangium saharense TaxID=1706840 RepID=UPI00343008F0
MPATAEVPGHRIGRGAGRMRLGKLDHAMSARLGLGCLPLGGVYGPADPARVLRLVRFALDSGVVWLDTADVTPGGEVQRIVGQAIAGRRDEVVIAAHGPHGVAGMAEDCERTLRRLGVEHLDLYHLHLGGSRIPVEEAVGAAASLVASGKVGALGIGGVDGERLLRAHATHPLASVVVEYSLLERGAELDLLPAARGLGLLVAASRPLARGLLTGRTAPQTEHGPVAEMLDALAGTAAELNLGPARLALAWLLSRGDDILPLPGTRDRVHLEMNLSARRIELPPEAEKALTALRSARLEAAVDLTVRRRDQ